MSQVLHDNPREDTLEPAALAALQRKKLAAMLQAVMKSNEFYQAKLQSLQFDAIHDPLERLPFTTRKEIEADQAGRPPYGTNLTFPLESYTRMHQTSGTGG